tara:strand:+ start:12716 stop:12961 length:246 start_codon:yes stop_codon:yes gene_type:complete
MAITRKILKDKYNFRPTKEDKKILYRRIGGAETIDVFGNALCYRGEVMATLECMTLDNFDNYLERLIRSLKKRNEVKSNSN